MKKLNVVFFGGKVLGHRCLKVLSEYQDKINVDFVITSKKDGEVGSDWNPSILSLTKELGFNITEDLELLKKRKNIDLILNVFCDKILPKEILDIPKLGAINFHYGKLPQYRGRFIVTHMILNGEEDTCVTSHYMEEKVDTGDIIFEKPLKILPDDTARSLYFRCTDTGVGLFKKILDTVLSNEELPRKPQEGVTNYYPFEPPNNCEIDLGWDEEKIKRFIRAVTFEPVSNAWLKINDLKYNIYPWK